MILILIQLIIAEREHGGSPLQYILTPEQMMENEYPMPSYIADVFEKPAGWVETPQSKDVSEKPKVFAIDCEMVSYPRPFRKPHS